MIAVRAPSIRIVAIFGLCGATVSVALYSIAYLLIAQTWSRHGATAAGYGLDTLFNRADTLGVMWLVYLVPAIATGLMASSTKEMPVTRWVLACVATGAVTNAITNLTYQQDLAAALQCAVCGAVGALLAAALTIRSRR